MLYPVILCGGTGTRLWPLSRALYPKQLLPLVSNATMVQETVNRVHDSERFHPPLLICNNEHRFLVAEQLREIGVRPQGIVLEPEGRNTAPAAAIAALMLQRRDPHAILAVLPSDHAIADTAGFLAAMGTAAAIARSGALVTFGMRPTKAETAYGYIQRGPAITESSGAYRVERFVEKPDAASAETMVSAGGWFWNSGMFVFSAETYLLELERYCPGIVSACDMALERGREDMEFFRLDPEAFSHALNKSIDYAVMEHTGAAAVVPADIGWSDVGSWSALWDITEKDSNGNVLLGNVEVQDARQSYIRSEAGLLAAVGVEDLIIVSTEDAVLVSAKSAAQDVKLIVDRLRLMARQEQSHHVRVYRPWGDYQSLGIGQDFQVKRLSVKPGAKLSLQSHAHRAEHWVVVQGVARVTRDEEVFDLNVNESAYIPLRARHRLENPGDSELIVIEVQSGSYLGEDDIVRYEDVYNRAAE